MSLLGSMGTHLYTIHTLAVDSLTRHSPISKSKLQMEDHFGVMLC